MHDFTVIKGKCSDFTIVPLKTDFEVRCEKASEMMLHWTLLQSIPANDESRKEERAQYKNKFMALLSDPLQVNIEPLLADGAKRENVLKLVSAMYEKEN